MRAALLVMIVACSSSSDVTYQSYQANNAGMVCLYAGSPPAGGDEQMFEPGASVSIGFSAACFNGCDIDRSASCSVGSDLVIQSTVMWTHETWHVSGVACTEECGIISATCVTDPLPAGDYTFSFAGGTESLTVPSLRLAPCIKTPPVN